MPFGGLLIGGLASLAGGIGGSIASAGDAASARGQAETANQILQQIQNAPDIQKPLILDKYRQQGILTPAMEHQINLGISQAAQAKGSASAQQAQLDALQQIQQRSKTGLTATDRAALNQILQQTGAATQGQRGAIMQQMQARGLGGGGAELAAQLAAAQGGANVASQQSDALAAQAAQQALQAAGMSGQLGGQIQGQQFGEQFQTGQAADAFRQFDVQNQIAQQQRNVAAQNQAQQYNLNTAQNISNANVSAQNQEYYNQLQRQMQEAEFNRQNAAMKAGGAQNLGNFYGQQAQQTRQGWSNLGAGIGGLATKAFGGSSTPDYSEFNAPATPEQKQMFAGPDAGASISNPTVYSWEGGKIHDYREGGQVPGQAPIPGDHPANDTVPAMLSPGEIVVPRSMAKSSLGKRLAKLLEDHHQLRKDMGE